MNRTVLCLGWMSLGWWVTGERVIAQAVIPDTTLNSTVTRTGNEFTITNGTSTGTNLFHSFREFSIPTGGSAFFDNAATVQNIFSRVTGGTVSNIDGIIRANGTANLFLLNPNGILFGANASLNIGGSFIGTTANSIKFADGAEFSATSSSSPPLLTLSVPVGLQIGQSPGSIAINQSQLQVPSGKTLALVGGEITQTGGTLQVPGGSGRIELVGLNDNAQASLQPVTGGWSIEPTGTSQFKNITLRDGVRLLGHGFNSSAIRILGDTILTENDTRINSFNSGDQQGGDIVLTASTAIQMRGSASADLKTSASGNAGNLRLTAPTITFANGGFGIAVEPTATGNGGNAYITADVFQILKGGFANATDGAGNAGDVTINARRMLVSNNSGGGLYATGSGSGGNLNIAVDEFYMDSSSGFSVGTYLWQSYQGLRGNAGNINLTAKNSIIIRDDSGFNTDTETNGRGGSIRFSAPYIELDDTQINARSSGTGSSGSIAVSADTLRILNGGQLNVATRASGNAGNIDVNAKWVELSGAPTTGVLANKNTGILSGVVIDPTRPIARTGNGGNINLTSSALVIREGAFISASTSAGQGNGGNINLTVDQLDLLTGGQVMAVTRSQGNAGTITIHARDRIQLSGQDAIHTARMNAYSPGATYSDVEYNLGAFSGIYANATPVASGSGGSLKITTGELRLQEGAIVSVSSLGSGNAGNLTVNANQVRLDQASIQAESTAGDQGNLFFNLGQTLLLRNGSTITTNATRTANGGNITINAPVILGLENSDIIANANQGRGGNVQIITQGLFGLAFRDLLNPREVPTNDITASSQASSDGVVQITTPGVDPNAGLLELPVDLVDSSQQIANACASDQGSSFVASGRGGMLENPLQDARGGNRTWQDLRPLPDTRQTNGVGSVPVLVEATKWERDFNGKVQLIAEQPVQTAISATCAAN